MEFSEEDIQVINRFLTQSLPELMHSAEDDESVAALRLIAERIRQAGSAE